MPQGGRFGSIFPRFRAGELDDDAIEELLERIDDSFGTGNFNARIPAGYTYLGQFIDHDLTFDPTSQLATVEQARATVSLRTPRFDLDSVYGAGPDDQPYLYEWTSARDRGVKLLVGASSSADGGTTVADLPRNGQGIALIGDPRNDENLIVAQLHLLFIGFHNRVVDHIRTDALTGRELFEAARKLVRWHYQWIVVHDFLRRIVGQTMASSVLRPGARETVERRVYRFSGQPFIPREFSGAAYRYGHSMVRNSYELNAELTQRGIQPLIFDDDADPASERHLVGFRALPPSMAIEWELFFEVSAVRPQRSRTIDTEIAAQLLKLPAHVNAERESLPRLNLRRGRSLGLPPGRRVARAMDVPRLSTSQLRLTGATHVTADQAPLWWYVLCEAASELGDDGEHLGPVGGRIVAEVLAGLLEGDPDSYLSRDPAWKPDKLIADRVDFQMGDLVRFTEQVAPVAGPSP